MNDLQIVQCFLILSHRYLISDMPFQKEDVPLQPKELKRNDPAKPVHRSIDVSSGLPSLSRVHLLSLHRNEGIKNSHA